MMFLELVRNLKMTYFKSKHAAQLDISTLSSNKDTVVLRLIFIYLFISLRHSGMSHVKIHCSLRNNA